MFGDFAVSEQPWAVCAAQSVHIMSRKPMGFTRFCVLKRAQDFPPEQKSRFWDYFGNFLQCFTDFQKAVSSQPVEGFFRSAPEMKARDAYVPFLL